MKRLAFFALLAILSQHSSFAQKHFFDSKNAYLGQKRPLDTPLIFAQPLLVPDSGVAMDRSAFSADGKEFYYCNAQSWFDARKTRVRYFKYDGKKWQGPFTLIQGYYAPTFSTDGQTLYLSGGKGEPKRSVLHAIHRDGAGWTQPDVFMRTDFGNYDLMPTRRGIYYLGSNGRQGNMRDFKTYDFCTLKISGQDTVVKSLGAEINTPAFDGDFYVSPDESYMVISYKEKPDYECELGISFRRKDGTWPAPINLGPLINDGDAHRWGEYVSPDGRYLFYTKGTNSKDCHLYWVRFDTLERRLQQQTK